MSLLVRKIERSKWVQNDILNGQEVSADAITNCMKTSGNTLSVWQIADESNLEEAVLAIASNFKSLDAIDIALFDESNLGQAGLQIVATPGITPVARLKSAHRNLAGLTYRALGIMASFTIECFKRGKVLRFTKGQLRKLLRNAIQAQALSITDLQESLRLELSNE